MNTWKNIKGHWTNDGFLDGYGTLPIEIEDGKLWDAGTRGEGNELYCRQYGADCPLITNGCWTFLPDEDDLARLGIVPVQMIPA